MESSSRKRKLQQKRKMDCCDSNAERYKKNIRKPTIQCDYCKCKFYQKYLRDNHMRIHECGQCLDIALDDDQRIHRVRHQQEAQIEKLQEQRQRKMDDDFVLGYVKANRLKEYRSQLDYAPDFDYIVFNYRFEKDEWLSFVKKFKRPFLKLFFGSFKDCSKDVERSQHQYLIEQMNAQLFAYLLENRALSVLDAIDFLNILMVKAGYDDYASVVVLYLLDNGCKIKAEWVARAIGDDGLIERIKAKQTFTFGDIHKARQWDVLSAFDVHGLKTFYTQIQKHFFNPNFDNPFDGIDEDITKGITKGVIDRARNKQIRYFYDKENDQLFQLEASGKTRSHGSFKKAMNKSLEDLLKEYVEEMKVYLELDTKLIDLIAERDRQLAECEDRDQLIDIEKFFYYEIDKNAAHEPIEQGYVVSELYFAISLK